MMNNLEDLKNTEKGWNDLWINIFIEEILIIFSYIIRFLRWKIILNSIDLNPPILKNIYIWLGSFAFTATPGKAGEVIRVILLNKECKMPSLPVMISLIIERLTDVIAVLIIFFWNSYLIPMHNFNYTISPQLIIIIILSFLIFYKRKNIKNLFLWTLKKLLPNKELNLKKNIEIMRTLTSPKNITISIILGLMAWILEGTSFYIILKGFDLSISLMGATFAHTTSSLIGAITFVPGGLGSTEASTIGLLALQGIPISLGTSATLLIRLMTLWFATILGLICLLLNKNIVIKKALVFSKK